MSIVDKFSFALNRGYDKLSQPTEVLGSADTGFSASVSYFSINRDGHGSVDVAKTFGFQIVRESEISEHRAIYEKVGDSAHLNMLDKTDAVFKRLRSGEISLEDMNVELKQETEDFYQKYIADEVITQTYNPISRAFIPNEPEDPEDRFVHKRWLQKVDERIGKENEIPHERIRSTWGLD